MLAYALDCFATMEDFMSVQNCSDNSSMLTQLKTTQFRDSISAQHYTDNSSQSIQRTATQFLQQRDLAPSFLPSNHELLSASEITGSKRKTRRPAGTPDPDAEVIGLSPKTLLESDHFVCDICHQGFQRNQNLQMHRRKHKVPWKLIKKSSSQEALVKRVYVCPEPSCLHHHPHHALGDLVGIKKHFRRKHSSEKRWQCEKCSKGYAIQSDYKAHVKTCGTRGHCCSCGRVFSRVDSFIQHQDTCSVAKKKSLLDHSNQTSVHAIDLNIVDNRSFTTTNTTLPAECSSFNKTTTRTYSHGVGSQWVPNHFQRELQLLPETKKRDQGWDAQTSECSIHATTTTYMPIEKFSTLTTAQSKNSLNYISSMNETSLISCVGNGDQVYDPCSLELSIAPCCSRT